MKRCRRRARATSRLVFLGQLVDTKDRDDVLEVAIALQHALRLTGRVVVLLAHDERIQNARGGCQRIDGRVDAQLRQVALESNGRVEVAEGRGRGRVGVVVRGHVNGLQRGDRTGLGRGDAFLKAGHLRGQVGLVAHGRRHSAEQCRHLGASLGETEDVVDEQQDVAALVTEELRERQAGQATRKRAPGGSFIWPKAMTVFSMTPDSVIS